MSFFIPPGPTIPGSVNLTSATINTNNASTLANQGDVNITTTNGTVKLIIGTNVYIWPTTPPPGYQFVLGIDNIQTVEGITIYTLGWVMGFICFHASTKVTLDSGIVITMDKLRYGDKVLAVDNQMNLIYSPVVDFTGVFPDKQGSYVKVYHRHGEPLMVSGIHLVYADGKFIMAQDLKVGMKLMSCMSPTVSGMSEITHVETGFATGWYTPLTQCGTVVANNVVASCHTTNSQAQVRAFYKPLYLYLYFFPKKVGELPKEENHWYSIKFRRGPVGKFLMKILSLFIS